MTIEISQPASENQNQDILSTADELIKNDKYKEFFELISGHTYEGDIKKLSRRIRKLELWIIANDITLWKKYSEVLSANSNIFEHKKYQRYLITHLKQALEENDEHTSILALQLITLIKEKDLQERLSKTDCMQTCEAIEDFLFLYNQGVDFLFNAANEIVARPKTLEIEVAKRINKFFTDNDFQMISLDLQDHTPPDEIVLTPLAIIYDGLHQNFKIANPHDLRVFKAALNANTRIKDFRGHYYKRNDEITFIVETRGILPEQMRFLIDEHLLVIVAYDVLEGSGKHEHYCYWQTIKNKQLIINSFDLSPENEGYTLRIKFKCKECEVPPE